MSTRNELEAIFRAALASVDARTCVERALDRGAFGQDPGPWTVLSVGKAAAPMLQGALARLAGRVRAVLAVTAHAGADALVSMQAEVEARRDEGSPNQRSAPRLMLETLAAGHPVPDLGSARAGAKALALANDLGGSDRLLVLLSGGGSALWAAPCAGVSLSAKQAVTRTLLRAGVSIAELNAVRKHLSRIKGGGLALRAAPCPVFTLALSDVQGDRPEAIASGPTVADPTTYRDALEVLQGAVAASEASEVPAEVWAHLQAGERGLLPETPKPGELEPPAHYGIVGSIEDALAGAARAGASRKLRVESLGAALYGEVRTLSRWLAERARQARRDGVDLLVAGGEPTVQVTGPGRGGRAQELALAFALEIADVDAMDATVALFAGTDGVDGPTDAAGAFADARLVARGRSLGLDASQSLVQNDTYRFHGAAGSLFSTGPTGTNVTDLAIIRLSAPEASSMR